MRSPQGLRGLWEYKETPRAVGFVGYQEPPVPAVVWGLWAGLTPRSPLAVPGEV